MKAKKSRKNFHEKFNHMVETLKNEICSDKYADGDFLPSENALAERFELSRNSVRRGLEILMEMGLIEKRPRVGNVVVKAPVQEQQVLRFGYYPSLLLEVDLQELLRKFEQHYPTLRVYPVALPSHLYHQTLLDYLRHGLVDVFCLNHTDFLSLKERGLLASHAAELEPKPELYPFLNDHLTDAGALYAYSLTFSPVILCYNLQHLQECGVEEPDSSWTWQDLERAAQRLTKADRAGFYIHVRSNNRWPVFWLQTALDSPAALDVVVERLLYANELICGPSPFAAYLSENDADAEELFAQEKVSMIMTTYWGLNRLKEAPFPFDIAPLPHFGTPATLVLNIGVAVNAHGENKAASQLLVDYLLSEEAQLHIREHTLSIPSRKGAAEWRGPAPAAALSRYNLYREIIPTYHTIDTLGCTQQQLEEIRSDLRLFWSKMMERSAFEKRFTHILKNE